VRVLTASATGSPACARIAAPAIASLRAHLEADVGGGAARRAFLAVLDDSRRLAATGCILARTAKLEATYGAELAGPLTSCAVSFTELADSVDESVRTIARRLADRTWSQP
ncbi:MAG TPA: hypothetical protein VFP84_29915, partial [Kofleriaceae bacterium]|nr:hypothetical protein [Kofleriaceae bacterium]